MSHYNTLQSLVPYVESGAVPSHLLQPDSMELPSYMSSPPVGGTVPRRGSRRTPQVVRGVRLSLHGPQPDVARRFSTPPVPLPYGFGGYY
jgi:hypothetical protein